MIKNALIIKIYSPWVKYVTPDLIEYEVSLSAL